MKTYRYLVAALAIMFVMSFGAVHAENIGYIDMERLFQSLKEGRKIQADVQLKRADYEKLVDSKQKEIEKAKADKKSDEEIQKVVDKIKEELKPKQEEILKFESEVQQKLLAKIKEMTKVVAKRYSVDVVIDKRVVYFGGFDLTDFIADRLNK